MPRGISSYGVCNAKITRYVCPDCKRKGLHSTWYIDTGQLWVCMYRNCISYQPGGKLFKPLKDPEVLKANPILQE